MNNEKNLNIPRYNLIFNFQSLLQFQQQRLKNIVTFPPPFLPLTLKNSKKKSVRPNFTANIQESIKYQSPLPI